MMKFLLFAAVLTVGACSTGVLRNAGSVAAARQIVLGQGYEIASAALGEARQVNVYVPPDYATSGKSYPVLYLIDGGVDQDFIHIAGLSQHALISASFREMIVVGIATQDRRRELTFPATNDETLRKEYPTHGESAKFRAFVASEVKPWVERSYRTDGHDAVIGESLAGLFVIETFLKQPDLFDGYAAIDPSLWWDNGALAMQARGLLAAQSTGERAGVERAVYMAVAKGVPAMRVPQAAVANTLKAVAPAGLNFTYDVMEDEQHSTIYHRAALTALRKLFANPPEAAGK